MKRLFSKYRSHNDAKLKAEQRTLRVFNSYKMLLDNDAPQGKDGFDIDALISEKKKLINCLDRDIKAQINAVEDKLIAQLRRVISMIHSAPPPSLVVPPQAKKTPSSIKKSEGGHPAAKPSQKVSKDKTAPIPKPTASSVPDYHIISILKIK